MTRLSKHHHILSRRRRIYTVLDIVTVVALAYLCACTAKSDYRPDHGVPPCEITAPMDSLFSTMFPDGEPGAIVTVIRNGEVVFNHAYGVARFDTKKLISDSTLFNLASTSKSFSAAALLKLCEQGLIGIDDPIDKYFSEFKGDFFKEISIRHILTHSSGLPDLRPKTNAEWEKYLKLHSSTFGDMPDYRIYGSEKEHMNVFQNLDSLEFTPGTHYQRQDPAFILVAPLIERVTHCDFEEWMKENIFGPAGLKETYYIDSSDDERPNMAHGYAHTDKYPALKSFTSDDGKWKEYDFGEADFFLTKADRGVYSTARDFRKWQEALWSGRIISADMLEQMTHPHIQTHIPKVWFGLGAALLVEPDGSKRIYHIDTNGGFAAIEGNWLDKHVQYYVFSNRADWDQQQLFAEIDTILRSKGWL